MNPPFVLLFKYISIPIAVCVGDKVKWNGSMAVATGKGFTLVVTEDGHIFASGKNEYGQLGVGDFDEHDGPCIVNCVHSFGGHEVAMVAAGPRSSACVTNDGSLWYWGNDMDMAWEQDSGTRPHTCIPAKMCKSLHGNSPVIMVACGFSFMLILTADGRIWSVGNGGDYQLGTGSFESCRVPTCIDPAHFDAAEIGMVSAAGSHCMAVSKTGGRLWTWGNNYYGQCGVFGNGDVETPTLIPSADLGNGKVAFVSCGFDFSMIVTTGGVVWSCGNNSNHETGLSVPLTRPRVFERVGGDEYFGPGGARMVSCGFSHSLIIAKDNSVWCCGSDQCRELGCPRRADGRPGLVDSTNFQCVHSEVWSDNDVQVVAAGERFSVAITYGGLVYIWGQVGDSLLSVRSLAAGALGFAGYTTDHARAGHWHNMNRARALAFAMGAHAEFANNAASGGTTPYSADFPEEMLQGLLRRMRFSLGEGSSEGVQALLGFDTEDATKPD